MRIGGYDAPKGQLDDVAAHQGGGGSDGPGAIAPNRGVQGEPRLQRGERRLRLARLEVTQKRVEDEQPEDDCRLHIIVENQLQNDRRLKQPWHRRPELADYLA